MSLGPDNSPLNVRLTARDRLELNLTSAFIELSITSMTMWSKEAERFKRGQATGAPFRIRNKTGLALLIWPEGTDQKRQPTGVKRLDDGADVPWRFEDKRHTRDVSNSSPSCADSTEHLRCAAQLAGHSAAEHALGGRAGHLRRPAGRAGARAPA